MKLNRRSVLAGLGGLGLGAHGRQASAQAPLPEPELMKAPTIQWGVCGHPFNAYPDITLQTQLDLLLALGMTHYRVRGVSRGLERLYPLAEQSGVSLLPVVMPYEGWKERDPDTLYTESRNKARAISRYHRGRFPVWECGNELESFAIIQPCEYRDDGTQYPCEWGPAGGVTPPEYFGARWDKVSAVVRGLVDGVGEGDPDAKRAIGTAGWGHLGAFERWRDDGIDWEITAWHDYPTVSEEYLDTLAGFGKPIWITEFNAGSGGSETDEVNARMLTERIAYYREMAPRFGIEAAFVYELLDEPYWSGFESQMGLYRMEGSREEGWRVGDIKPAGEAVKAALGG